MGSCRGGVGVAVVVGGAAVAADVAVSGPRCGAVPDDLIEGSVGPTGSPDTPAGVNVAEGIERDGDATYNSRLEADVGRGFGGADNPLRVSGRSGAAISMPGMMDTILNLGLNDASVNGLAAQAGTDRFAWDAYRRLINMFGDVVMSIDHAAFEAEMTALKQEVGKTEDTALTAGELRTGPPVAYVHARSPSGPNA